MRFLGVFLFLVLWTGEAWAESYSAVLEGGLKLRYEHRNQKSQQITGYSELSHLRDDRGRIEERLMNRKPDGELFQEKHTLFDSRGRLLSYREKDYRSDFEVTDRVENGRIESEITKDGQTLRFVQEYEEDMVPFEVLALHLQKHLSQLRRGEVLKFKLYMPQLAFELKKKGMNRDLAKLAVAARITGRESSGTPRGEEKVVTLVVEVTNPMIQMLLSSERSRFELAFLNESPHYLFYFSEPQTRTVLVEIERPSSQAGL